MGDLYRQCQARSLAIRLQFVVALPGSLLPLLQIILPERGLDGLCFSGGARLSTVGLRFRHAFLTFSGESFFRPFSCNAGFLNPQTEHVQTR